MLDEAPDDEWILSDLPTICGMIGGAAVGAVTAHLENRTRALFSRTSAAECLESIGASHPEHRESCVAALAHTLERFAENDELLNAILIGSLMDLDAVEAAPLMEAAFRAGRVDLRHAGDWEDVQVELGLIPQRLTPRAPIHWFRPPAAPNQRKSGSSPEARRRAKEKAKRKAARAARKRNRRK